MAEQLQMPVGLGEVDWTDIFAGAGGSSLGLEFVPGMRVTQALNHWDLAVEAHNANFPFADHDVHDVQEIPASRFRRTRCLWASPDCTHHAYCRGPKADSPEAQRSRSTFNDIVRFTEHHRYDAIVVENVIEARLWCEASKRKHGWDPVRKEYRCSCGIDFDQWYEQMLALGYEGRIVYFNSQFALPTPQSRDRMYVVFWRKGLRAPNLDFQPISWCSSCETVVRAVQTWKPASRKSARTQPGMYEWGRYGAQYLYACPLCGAAAAPAVTGAKTILDWSLPMHRIGDKPKAPNTRERIRGGWMKLGAMQPLAVQVGGHLFERRPGVRVWSIDDPLRTVHCTQQMALVTPAGGQKANARSADEPMHTVLGNDRLALVLRYGGQSAAGRNAGEPMQTITAHDREIGLVIPNREHAVGASLAEPIATITTAPAQHMLVQVNRGAKGKTNDRNAHTLDEPTRTVAGHGELALVELRGDPSRAGGANQVKTVEEPAGTVAANGNHHGLLVYNGVPGFVRDIADAAGTITGRDKQALLVPYYSNGVPRPVAEPMGTVTSKDREALVVTDADIDDCLFRMLQWHELLRAQQMHQHGDGRPYELTARRRDKRGRMRELSNEQRVKMIGNAVSSPVAAMLGSAIAEILRDAA